MRIAQVIATCENTNEGTQKMGIQITFSEDMDIEKFLAICRDSKEKQYFRVDQMRIIVGNAVLIPNG